MKLLPDLFAAVADKVRSPVLLVLGSPWPATQLANALPVGDIDCFQMDAYQAERLREKLAENKATANVVVAADLWDLPRKYATAIFPAAAQGDRELKIDMIEQGFHVLEEGGLFLSLSEYERDNQFAKWHKNVFGKAGETPRNKAGTACWSTRKGDQPRRRHAITFHARTADGNATMPIQTWPGTFSYGRMDDGSRAMLEVAPVPAGCELLDLGCGNGSVGCLVSPLVGPTGRITFVDSHARAVKLAQINAEANGVTNGRFVLTANPAELGAGSFDVILANPPYYANSGVGLLFIQTARTLLKPGGRFVLVTKMPVQTIPEVVETFGGGVESVENRGYTIIIATT